MTGKALFPDPDLMERIFAEGMVVDNCECCSGIVICLTSNGKPVAGTQFTPDQAEKFIEILQAFVAHLSRRKNCRTSVGMIEKHYTAHLVYQIDAAAVNVRRTSR